MLTAAIAAPKISLDMISSSAMGKQGDALLLTWIALPQIPARLLEHNAKPVCAIA
jgi:hypothetical protein